MSKAVRRKRFSYLESMLGPVAKWCHRRPVVAIVAAGLLSAASVPGIASLKVNADLASLLPSTFESVQGLAKLKERFGGVGYVAVVAQNAPTEALERFADHIAPKLEVLETVNYVDYKRPVTFFRDRQLYYLNLEDLEIVQERVEARLAWSRARANPLYVDIENTKPPSLDFSDIEDKYQKKGAIGRSLASTDIDSPYYSDSARRILVLLVKPAQLASDFSYSKRVVEDVASVITKIDLHQFDEGMTVALSGRYKKRIDQKKAIESDLAKSSIWALLGVTLYVAFYFRSLVAIGLIMIPLCSGLIWTLGFTQHAFGELNILTSFVAAILAGLGIDHGVHLLSRYNEERGPPEQSEAAVGIAFSSTGHAVILAALTTTIGFAGLSISEFKAFREFGIIIATGTVFVVVAYILLLPALLGLVARFMPVPKPASERREPMRAYARVLARWSPAVFWLTTVAAVGAMTYAPSFPFNYDFAAIEGAALPSFRLDKVVNEVLGRSQTPIVVLTDDIDAESDVVSELRKRSQALRDASGIDYIFSRADLVPKEQEDKEEILESLSKTLSRLDPATAGESRERLETLMKISKAKPFELDDLPREVLRQFEPAQANLDNPGGVVLVFPSVSLSDGKKVRALAREVREIPLANGNKISASSEALVVADVLNMVLRESPIVVVLTLVLVFLSLWLFLGHLPTALLTFAPALLTSACTLGAAALLGLELNYLNIIIVPVLFGISVDEGVHLVVRNAEAGGDLSSILPETGRAILGATLTTAIGFSALTIAHHPGLNSLGRVALLGLAINLVVALVWLAALLGLATVRRHRLAAVGLWNRWSSRWSGDISSVGGAGYSPLGPGTFGAIAALPVGWALSLVSTEIEVGLIVAMTIVATWAADRYLEGDTNESDPSEIVSDEFVGMLIALAFVPWTLGWVTAAFVLFRAFDILKPGPVGYLDRNVGGAKGVMLDDVAAGLMAGALLLIIRIAMTSL